MDTSIHSHDQVASQLPMKVEKQNRGFLDGSLVNNASILSTLDIEEIFDQIIEKISQAAPHSGANITLINWEQQTARIERICACYAKHGLPEPISQQDFKFTEWHRPQLPLDESLAVVSSEPQNEAHWKYAPDTAWIRSYIAAPILMQAKIIGFLNVESDIPDAFTMQHRLNLQTLADQAAIAIHNAQMYQTLKHYSEYLENMLVLRTTALKQTKECVEAILTIDRDALLLIDGQGIIQQSSQTFLQIFQYSSQEICNVPFTQLLTPDFANFWDELLQNMGRLLKPFCVEMILRRKDFTPLNVKLSISRIVSDTPRFICILRDIKLLAEQRDSSKHSPL